jgi:cell fate (sporulation/competence/biofilm development) regulator YlbF (YheA/YmcA/DUF963 family)
MKERVSRVDVDYLKFTKLRRQVKADMRRGVNPTEDKLRQLIELDKQLDLRYSEWQPNFPAKK